MPMVMNEGEQAKNELMRFGIRGMRWGIRKADTRLALHVGPSKLSMVPGKKKVKSAVETKNKKADVRFEKYLKGQEDRFKSEKGMLDKKLSEIKSGPGSRWSKLLARERAINEANANTMPIL